MVYDFSFRLPAWIPDFLNTMPQSFPTMEDRMRLVIALARENVQRKSGGPFGAGVFDASGLLIAPGVNLVEPDNCSILHAEMVAIALAQKKVGRYDLSDSGQYEYELTSSTEPCAMCFGAIPWSGVTRLVCAAREEDARAVGFDEGPKLDTWQSALEKRGIDVVRDILRQESAKVLQLYVQTGGIVYNGRGEKNT
jgi:tRNA(Arg) A34 adenosine deaminase TadA